MVNLVRKRVSIEHLLPESRKHLRDYLRAISEHLFSMEDNAQRVDAATLRSISKEASVNIIADVYLEGSTPSNANRIWKVREKKEYANRRSYFHEAFILKWLQERHAPVPGLIALLDDVTRKDDLRKELGSYTEGEELERLIEKGPEKEALVMRKLKEPRHDQDLAYVVGKIHDPAINEGQVADCRKLLQTLSSHALESIVTVDVIGNFYYKLDVEGNDIELLDPLEENPEYYQCEISKNILRIAVANLIEQGAMRDNEDEISSYKLPAELEARAKKVFAPVVEQLSDESQRGFVHGETQPFHLAMHESPTNTGHVWRGYHLFDFDKSRIDNVLLDTVRYLNNPIARLPFSLRKKLFAGAAVYAAKVFTKIKDNGDFPQGYTSPYNFKVNGKIREELQKFTMLNLNKVNSLRRSIKGLSLGNLVKAKDYLSFFTYLELAGRASKTGYGKERGKYADLHGKVDFFHNSSIMENGNQEAVEFGKFYEPSYLRKHCAREMHHLLDRMIRNKRKTLGYQLSHQEVERLTQIKSFLEELKLEYGDKEVPVKYFNPNVK